MELKFGIIIADNLPIFILAEYQNEESVIDGYLPLSMKGPSG